MSIRTEIRKKIIAQRKQLDSFTQQNNSLIICERFLEFMEMIPCDHLASYIAHNGEVDPEEILDLEADREHYLPILDPDNPSHLLFQRYHIHDKLSANQFGIPEPVFDEQKLINAEDLDCVLVPLVAFDTEGNRLGMGVGYYDYTFKFLQHVKRPHKPILIGLAYEFQKVENCEAKAWDIPLDFVITEKNLYRWSSK